MANLFEIAELVSYLQVPAFDTAMTGTATLARDLVTTEIRSYVGPIVYDAMTDLSAFRGVALAVAKRIVLNPEGLRSMTVGGYSETFSVETLGDAVLTESEQCRIDRTLGRSGGAFTIRPARLPDCPIARHL